MNRRILNSALRSVMIVAIAAVIAVSPVIAGRQAVRADTTTTVPTPTISVSGTGKVSVKPNLATTNFGMFTHADTATAAQSENDAAIAKVTAALKAAGIKEEDIQTSVYSLQPHYTWDKENDKNVLDGYDMSHSLNVIVRTIADTGKIVSLIAENGANTVNGVSFGVDDATLEQTKLAAIDLAMANARAKADAVAKAIGKTVQSVQTVTLNENYYNPYVGSSKMQDALSAAPVEAGSLNIQIDVSVIYTF
jgi:hypothetical protein